MTPDDLGLGVGRLRELMPRGTPLSDEDWAKRHATISTIALLHVPAVFVYALAMGVLPWHAILEVLPVAAGALLGAWPGTSRAVRELATTLGLVSSSAVLVHLSGGYIELHFHFFVVVALVTLYQQWGPFLLAIAFVGLHHGIAGVVDPTSVYNHPDALARPWRWAWIHAGFIGMASAVGLANWKLNELARQRAEGYFRRLYEGEHAIVQRIDEADRLKRELVAAVSHEFRTPLTAILGFAHSLRRAGALTPEQIGDFATRIHMQGRRLQQLIENLLEAEKPLDDIRGSCDAAAVVRSSVDAAVATGRHGDRPFVVEVAPDLRLPLAPAAAQVVLTNLIGNALKFGTPGTSVTVRAVPAPGGGTTIEVRNYGPEVAPHLRERMFEPFVQLDSSDTRPADGVGLGLHLVRRFVAASGGGISVASADGETTFTAWVPAPAPPVAAVAAAAQAS